MKIIKIIVDMNTFRSSFGLLKVNLLKAFKSLRDLSNYFTDIKLLSIAVSFSQLKGAIKLKY